MFRFYKISRFQDGRQHIDIGRECDLATVHEELEDPLAVGIQGADRLGIIRTVTEFLVYES